MLRLERRKHVRDVGVASSNLATPTSQINYLRHHNQFRFLFPHSFRTVSIGICGVLLEFRVIMQIGSFELIGRNPKRC